jgi:hypothetical protein
MPNVDLRNREREMNMKHVIVQVGFDKATNMPLYQVATLAGGSQNVYKTAIGADNAPAYLSTAMVRLAALEGK